jgi:hypothetical protein
MVEAPWPQPMSATRAPSPACPRPPRAREARRARGWRRSPAGRTARSRRRGRRRARASRSPSPVRKRSVSAGLVLDERRGDVERARQERGTLAVGQAGSLLRGQPEALGTCVVLDVAAGGLCAEPLADVPLVGPRALRELAGRHRRAVAHRDVQAELVADDDGRLMERGAEVPGEAADELLDARLVGHGVHGGHLSLLEGRLWWLEPTLPRVRQAAVSAASKRLADDDRVSRVGRRC